VSFAEFAFVEHFNKLRLGSLSVLTLSSSQLIPVIGVFAPVAGALAPWVQLARAAKVWSAG
jgi:hypothetical protein